MHSLHACSRSVKPSSPPVVYTAACGIDFLDAGDDVLALVESVCRTKERGDHVVIWRRAAGGPCTVAAVVRDGLDGRAVVATS